MVAFSLTINDNVDKYTYCSSSNDGKEINELTFFSGNRFNHIRLNNTSPCRVIPLISSTLLSSVKSGAARDLPCKKNSR